MVNGQHLYSGFLTYQTLKALYNTCQHSYTDGRGCHARCQSAHQERYSTFYPKCFTMFLMLTQPFTHTHTLTHQWCSQRQQFGVQYLAQGHFDMWTRGDGDRTPNLLISGRPARPPAPQYKQPFKMKK